MKVKHSCEVENVGNETIQSKNENLSPLISSLKRGTLLSGCVEVPSYDIRGGGRSLGEESPDPHLVNQSLNYLILDKYLS
jgi:hypothetical protein